MSALGRNRAVQPRESTGITELDEVVGGGLLRPSDTLVIGPVGSGTTSFCRQFVVSSLLTGRKVVAICTDESTEHFLRHFGSLKSFDVGFYLDEKKFIIVDLYTRLMEHIGIHDYADIDPSKEVSIDRVIPDTVKYLLGDSREELKGYNAVFDSITALSPILAVRDVHRLFREGQKVVREGNHVLLITAHEGALEGNFIQVARQQVDNVIRMKTRWVRSNLKREMIIEKMSYTEIKQPVLGYTITDAGIEII